MRVFVLLGLVAGCAIEESEFPIKAAEAWCKKSRSCDKEAFDAQWSSVDDCSYSTEDGISVYVGLWDIVGDYDEKEASECVHGLTLASCDDLDTWVELHCDHVYH